MRTLITLIFALLSLYSSEAKAGVFELGGAFSYSHNAYQGGSETWTRSWTGTFGYYFTADSEIEFSYQDSTNNETVPNVQDITYRDRVYSVNFVYYLAEDTSRVRPYVRAGVGQLNRDMSGSYQGGYKPGAALDQLTVIGGIGIKAKLSGRFGLKAEVVDYLAGGGISKWRDNMQVNIGGSLYF
jgi:hypothetical protein